MVGYCQFGKMNVTAGKNMRITGKSEGEIFHQNNSLGFDSIEGKFLSFWAVAPEGLMTNNFS